MSLTRAGYLNEFEIKISKQDFEKDFLKRKHYILQRPNIYMKIPNYFWYVAPTKAIPLCIPDYAGLIEVRETKNRFDEKYVKIIDIKRPRRLHDRKYSKEDMYPALRATMFKYWDLLGSWLKQDDYVPAH